MIQYRNGNLFESRAHVLVNTVNCVGVMGKGIAHQFKRAYPKMFDEYAKDCKEGAVRLGEVRAYPTEDRLIVNFPTKGHWRAKSKIRDIDAGLSSLCALVEAQGIQSLALPPLGCGNGGLDWSEVRALIDERLSCLPPDVRVEVYEPIGRVLRSKTVAKKPRVSLSHFVLADIAEHLDVATKLSLQKATYFFNVFADEAYFKFTEYRYGPYCPVIDKLGLAIRDYRDHANVSRSEFIGIGKAQLLAGTDVDRWDKWATSISLATDLLNRYVGDGELLATLHAVIDRDEPKDAEELATAFFAWSKEKAIRFHVDDVHRGLKILEHEGLVQRTLWGFRTASPATFAHGHRESLTVRLPAELIKSLREYAAQEDRLLDDVIARILGDGIPETRSLDSGDS